MLAIEGGAVKRPKKLGSGLVALLAHVEPELRERVREVAALRKAPFSRVVTEALVAGLYTIETTRARRAAPRRKVGGGGG